MRSALLSLLAALLLGSCGIFTAPEERLDLDVSVTPREFARGDTATIAVRAYNRTSGVLTFQSDACPLVFEILSESGDLAAPEGIACAQPLLTWDLQPGDSLAASYTWYGERWRNWGSATTPPPALLPAGEYRVFGVLRSIDKRVRSAPFRVALRAE